MDATLTFGEYMRRLRRAHQWNLNFLSGETGISPTQLSRLENDSAPPSVESVALLAQALDGDLKAMLQMADCLPAFILDRISSQAQPAANSVPSLEDEPIPGLDHQIVPSLKEIYDLDDVDSGPLALAIDGLASLNNAQRKVLIDLISSFSSFGT